MQGRFYYGWLIVVTLAATETISLGILYYTFAAVLPAMEQELHWSRVAMTGAFSITLFATNCNAAQWMVVAAWLMSSSAG